MMVVYVQGPGGTPLMPCAPVIARLLLKDGKAKVMRRTPFTLELLAQPEESYTQPLTLGVDTGRSVMGSAVADQNGRVLYLSEVEVRNDIAQSMQERAAARRNRRQRKTHSKAQKYYETQGSISVASPTGMLTQKHMCSLAIPSRGKSRDRRLEVHHMVFRSEQGSDEESNLLTLCKTCHDGLHTGKITLKQHKTTLVNSLRDPSDG